VARKTWRVLFSVINAEKNINFVIEHQCPQCGAPATLEETDRLFYCDYCRVKSYLIEKNYFRYVFPDNAPKGKPLLYYPYWRYKGILYTIGPTGVQHRFMDLSYQAVQSQYFPVSVGLRSQALKLKFASSELNGRILKPTFPLQNVMEIFDKRFVASLPKPILHQSHIGESLSLIYSPYYFDETLHDGILNQSVSGRLPDTFDVNSFPDEPSVGNIRFVPTLCSNCGWDLEGERDALVLCCKNCNSMWRGGKKGFKQIRYGHIPALAPTDQIIYLPFWRIKADVSGIDLVSYADLVRVANLPKVVQKGWENIGFRFWALAFKVRPQTLIRLAGNLTLAQPRDKLEASLPEGKCHPVTLPVTEAVESLKTNLADYVKPRKRFLSKLQEIHVRAISYILVYLPFVENQHDLVQPNYQVAVNKNQLRLSRNL